MCDLLCVFYFMFLIVEYGLRGVISRARTVVFEGFVVDIDDCFVFLCKFSFNSNKFVKCVSDEVEICWWFLSVCV